MSKKRFKIITLGCRTNQYESQAYVDQLLASGYTRVGEEAEADVCIVNTCTVTKTADLSSRQVVRRILKTHPNTQILATGCAVEKDLSGFAALVGKGQVISNRDKESLLPMVFPEESFPEFAITQFEAHTRAFVKIQDGCNSFCTYCIIPYVRGRSRSKDVDAIVKEVQTLVSNGYREVVLTGINIGDFDGNPQEGKPPVRLADLVRILDRIEGVERLRISSIDPDEVDEDLLDAVLHGRSTCHSLHIVLQSGSNAVLKRMNRKYTKQMFLDAIDQVQSASSDFTFTTDVIVGFPGETEEDFQETLDLVQEVQFSKVHMFPYSPRERTRAALFPNMVRKEIMTDRKNRLLSLSEKVAFDLREKYVGRQMTVLLEGKEEGLFGHTANFLPVFVRGKGVRPNEIVTVHLDENTSKGLIGTLA